MKEGIRKVKEGLQGENSAKERILGQGRIGDPLSSYKDLLESSLKISNYPASGNFVIEKYRNLGFVSFLDETFL